MSAKCSSHAFNKFGLVKPISNSSPLSLAKATISAFFILFKADFVGNSIDSTGFSAATSVSLDAVEPPNNLEKKPFFSFSLFSLIIIA